MKNDKMYKPETPDTKEPTAWTEQRLQREIENMYDWRDRVGLVKLLLRVARGEIKIDQ